MLLAPRIRPAAFRAARHSKKNTNLKSGEAKLFLSANWKKTKGEL
jgi:hypothetical protein